MERYTVLWSKAAEEELAAVWFDYPIREEVTIAADRLDAALREGAFMHAISLPNGTRIVSKSPLSIYFRVNDADRKVLVGGVQLTENN